MGVTSAVKVEAYVSLNLTNWGGISETEMKTETQSGNICLATGSAFVTWV
jgi:hypothetical protein